MEDSMKPDSDGAAITTAMLHGIPNKLCMEKLISQLNIGYEQLFDYVYIPMICNSKCNVGYAFINFKTNEVYKRFAREYDSVEARLKLPGFKSQKVLEVSPAKWQGCMHNAQQNRCFKGFRAGPRLLL
mmetsp:Transcript_76677/g.201192  ORF Transcript_76677/g.201192 Transcript_76677/m.201192 type:complete len:128 (+) Transcript_76677:1-384(+)